MQYRVTEENDTHLSIQLDDEELSYLVSVSTATNNHGTHLGSRYLVELGNDRDEQLYICCVPQEHSAVVLFNEKQRELYDQQGFKLEKGMGLELLIDETVIKALRENGKYTRKIDAVSIRIELSDYTSQTSEWPVQRAA